MSTQLRLKRGNTSVTSTFVGAQAEVTVDTDLNILVVHDGSTAGGFPVVSTTSVQTLQNKTFDGTLNINGQINATDGDLRIIGNIIPTSNVTYSLGNVDHQWKDLWVSGNTIYINNLAFTVNPEGDILIDGNIKSYSNTAVSTYLPEYAGNTSAVLTTSSQPYVTSVGNLTGLTVGGNTVINNTLYAYQLYSGGSPVLTNDTTQDFVKTANVSLYSSSAAYTTGTFYPTFSNIAGGNTQIGVSNGFTYNATAGNLSATGFVGTHWGPVAATTANVSSTLTVNGNLNVKGNISSVSNIEIHAGTNVSTFDTNGNVTLPNLVVIADIVASKISVQNLYAQNAMIDRGADQTNWNTLTKMGIYLVNRVSWSGTVGTPLDTTNYTGLLEVINTGDTAITQNYRPYDSNSISNVYWTRSQFNGSSWTAWTEIVNSAGYMDGGSF